MAKNRESSKERAVKAANSPGESKSGAKKQPGGARRSRRKERGS